MRYEIAVALLAGLAAMAVAAPPPAALTPQDRVAVFKAARFKARGNQYVRCEEDPPTASYVPGKIEVVDLNGDGRPEAWVTESSTFCYGNTEQFFVLVTKDESGAWRALLEEAGVPTALATKRQGWPDIEVGGPGFGKFPVRHWNGKTYDGPKQAR
ncbi:MAG TPA: hypothetical protein VMS22_03040 [Candidatus Eisenbacteria bacterium]|nr:hypothetical protein [Candidatus Eisenbacteria bacterium]